MKNNILNLHNYLESDKKKISNTIKLSKNFNIIFNKLKEDIKDEKKTLNVLNKNYSFNFKVSELKEYKKYKKIALIGMGGSILGAEALYGFLENRIKKKIYFFNDIDEIKLFKFKKKENLNKVLFIIISKSGNTLETLSNTFSLNIVKKNAKNLIIISEKKNNFLYKMAKNLNLFYIEHKNHIGGRYSVLSEVGIIPAYLMGINILKLRSKLLSFLKGKSKIFLRNSSIKMANYLNSKKYNNLIFLNYSPELEKFLFWCQQLIAESLGKKNKGFFPVISNVPKDHHSLLQLYLDGPKDKIFYIFYRNLNSKIKINLNNSLVKKNFLNKKSLNHVKSAQKNALIKSLKKNKIPFRKIEIKESNEEVFGMLVSYFIIETIIIGNLCKINPFNQPAVEEVKIFTKKLLS